MKDENTRRPFRRVYPSNMGPMRPEYFETFVLDGRDPNIDADLGLHDPIRTKRDWPYAYDPFTIWGKPGPHKECNGSDYTDRLSEWDHKKYERISTEVYNIDGKWQYPFREHNCRGDLIEKFLQRYHDNAGIKLLRVIEYCNASTGFTTYRLDYNIPSKRTSK